MCAVPRTGTDPTNNNQPYPDMAGTTTDENNFLRSFTNDTYLWYDEITDLDPGTFSNTQDYFDQLRTFGTTPSGSPKDQFSFWFDTLEWFDLFQGGVSAGYGAIFAIISPTIPREIVVAYTEPNSPASFLPDWVSRMTSKYRTSVPRPVAWLRSSQLRSPIPWCKIPGCSIRRPDALAI
ncbi:MAG: hypothetical protein IIB74_07205 [Proteobacteria bacterium]|nr:hypothetical protein [Pseudomonadota bacterium]